MPDSNALLECLAGGFAARFKDRFAVVEPAHMEIAAPSIADAYAKCVARGAQEIFVVPYFLGPGKHWTHDIPALAAEAAKNHPGTIVKVTSFIGFDDSLLDLLAKRVEEAERTGATAAAVGAGAR